MSHIVFQMFITIFDASKHVLGNSKQIYSKVLKWQQPYFLKLYKKETVSLPLFHDCRMLQVNTALRKEELCWADTLLHLPSDFCKEK